MNVLFRYAKRLFCLALLVLGGGCGSQPEQLPIAAGSSVLAIGDSVTYGTGAETARDYPSQLAARTAWIIHNYGVPGDTSAGIRNRIEAALADTRPELVLLEIGGNDFLRLTGNGEVKENIRATLRQIKARGIPVVLIAVPQFSALGMMFGNLPDAPLYAELAAEEGVPLIPDVFAEVLSDNHLKSDTIHPNSDGYQKMAEGFAERLIKIGYLASQRGE